MKLVPLGIAVTSTENTNLHIYGTFSWGLTTQVVRLFICFVATVFQVFQIFKDFEFISVVQLVF